MAAALTDGLSATARSQFVVLQQRFVAGLDARWAEIESAPDARVLQGALHRLAGSAASFGFERMGQCARSAELQATSGSGPALVLALASLHTEIELARSPASTE